MVLKQKRVLRCARVTGALMVVWAPQLATGSDPATATLTCAPGCRASLTYICITKAGAAGLPNPMFCHQFSNVIGEIPAMGCDPDFPVATFSLKLTESGANDLHVKGADVQCADTLPGTTSCDVDIPANQEPWGVELTVDALGNAQCNVILQPGAVAGVASVAATLTLAPVGACCLHNGTCEEVTLQDCTDSLGIYRGDGTLCGGVMCLGACCNLATNACTQLTDFACKELGKGYRYGGEGTPCGPGGTCIPTLSQWGVAVMAMLVLTAGTIVVMRRRAAVA